MELVIATTNRHKYREIRSLFSYLQIEILSLSDFPNYIQPEETGITFEENAILKSTHAASALQKWVIADDSGLVVPALEGRPGVFSRRYAGDTATDLENRRKLLKEMTSLSEEGRSAYYECALALSNPQGLKKSVIATCEGSIGYGEKGSNGFGYDAIFIKHGYNLTFAQLDEMVKNQVSHRAKAYQKLLPLLETIVNAEISNQ
jgi:XTP/dITP diphosphohydrolase